MPTFRTRGSGPLEDYLSSLETSATRVCELCPDRPEFSTQERLRQHLVDYHILTPTLSPENIQQLVQYLRRRKVVSRGFRDKSLAEKLSDIDRFADSMHMPTQDREEFARIIRHLEDRKKLGPLSL